MSAHQKSAQHEREHGREQKHALPEITTPSPHVCRKSRIRITIQPPSPSVSRFPSYKAEQDVLQSTAGAVFGLSRPSLVRTSIRGLGQGRRHVKGEQSSLSVSSWALFVAHILLVFLLVTNQWHSILSDSVCQLSELQGQKGGQSLAWRRLNRASFPVERELNRA